MAEWNKGKVLPSAINGGKEFTESDNLALDELNAIVNNSFYAAELVENSIAEVNNAAAQGKAELGLAVEQGKSELDAVAAQSKSELNDIVVDASELVKDAKKHIDTVVETANRAEETANLAEEKIDEFIKTEGNSVVTIGGVPQTAWSADFAESEKKKSTNLFDLSKVDFISNDVTVDLANNSFTFTGGNCWTKNNLRDFIDVQEGETVYLSGNTTFFDDGIIVGDRERWAFNTGRLVFPMDLDNPVLFMGDPSSSTTISNLQFEKYEITDYQSYHGQVTHNGDAPVVFAESEWQKSKNLFNINDKILKLSSNVEYSISNDIITITTASAFVAIKLVIPANTQVVISWGQGHTVKLYDEQVKKWLADIKNGGTYTNDTDEDLICALVMYGEGTYSKLQVEKGSVATDYQPYNGAIVHEKQIADVEHVETIYNVKTKNVLNDVAYTNGILVGSIVSSDEFAGYKALIVKSYRNQTRLTTEINLSGDTGNASGTPAIDASGDYFVIHSFRFYKNNNTFTFEHGGYMYVNSGDATFVKETADSDNRIVEILGVK